MKLIILSISLVTLLLFSACGDSSEDATYKSDLSPSGEYDTDLSASLYPRPIPQKYQGLTMEQLKAKATEVLYYDLNISTDYYKGKLVWFKGKVKEVFEIEPRGEVASGKKGDLPMYFIIGLKAEFSEDQNGLKPNDVFQQNFGNLMKIYDA